MDSGENAMKLNKIPPETKISPLGMSRFRENGENAVLLIHGFTGLTYEFDYLLDRISAEGFTVSLPRLPGHGTNARDFHESRGGDWLRRVMDEYLLLKTKYKSVSICGLSMGGLLTLILAELFEPDKIVVMAPAISIRNRIVTLTPYLKFFIPFVKGSWNPEKETDPGRKELGMEYWNRSDVARVADMIRLRKRALVNLSQVVCPTLTIVSEGDKTVAPDAVEIIEKGIKSSRKEHIILKDSPHVLVNGCEKEIVADHIIDWLKKE